MKNSLQRLQWPSWARFCFFLLLVPQRWLTFTWMGLLFQLDQNDGVKYHHKDKGGAEKHDSTCQEVISFCGSSEGLFQLTQASVHNSSGVFKKFNSNKKWPRNCCFDDPGNDSSYASAEISLVGVFPCLPLPSLLLIYITVFLHTDEGLPAY